tara:strand:- start:117 stop:224 length:108 start_codon:yes stop_codon:yes gene_type:complete
MKRDFNEKLTYYSTSIDKNCPVTQSQYQKKQIPKA